MMEAGDPRALHDGIIALLGAIVTASVFTLGFLSSRSHAALREAQHHLQMAPGDDEARADHADRLVRSARSWVVLGVNVALGGASVLVVFHFTERSKIGREGWTTLIGFLVVEATVLGLAIYDHFHVGRVLGDAKDRARGR